jgi:hypothetical protein
LLVQQVWSGLCSLVENIVSHKQIPSNLERYLLSLNTRILMPKVVLWSGLMDGIPATNVVFVSCLGMLLQSKHNRLCLPCIFLVCLSVMD